MSTTVTTPSRRRQTVRVAAGRWTRIATLWLVAATFAYLMVAIVLAALRDRESINDGGIFSGVSWSNLSYNWQQIAGFERGIFLTWFSNSLVLSLGATLVALVTAVPAGYVLARLRFPGRRLILFVTLLTMVIPNTVLVIPIFLGVAAVGALNELLPVILLLGFYPFGVYLATIHYATSMPHELVESARVDGCAELGIFFRIALPMARQATALIAFFAFVAAWTNYFLPKVLLPLSAKAPMSVGLEQLIAQSQLYDPTAAAGLNVELYMPQLALAAVVQMAPILLVFIAAQRYLVRGVNVGAVKG
ncbi:MAG: carbohydrate ABC transporter permease [Nostocoides sp.]